MVRFSRASSRLVALGFVVLLLTALLLGAYRGAMAQDPADQPTSTGRGERTPVIVEVEPGADPRAVARQLGVNPRFVYGKVFNGFAADLPTGAVNAAGRSRSVVTITPDLPVRAAAQVVPTGVDRIDAERSGESAAAAAGNEPIDVDVAVLDSGIAKHRDLNVVGGKRCIGDRGYDDRYGHGTHVAGTIGAKDNRQGVVGVAPGARLWAVKVLDDTGWGTTSSVICGLEWVLAKANTIEVVNVSISGKRPREDNACGDHPYHRAFCRVVKAGVPVVVAAGNGNKWGEAKNSANYAPAAYDEVITVSAFEDFNGRPGGGAGGGCGSKSEDDTFAGFSNYGADVDIVAPGVCIRSTWLNGTYKSSDGTSMATPHVAGAVALYKASNRGAGVADVRAWLLGTDAALAAASRPQDDPEVGLVGDDDPDNTPEPVLYLGPRVEAAPDQAAPDAPAPTGAEQSDAGDRAHRDR